MRRGALVAVLAGCVVLLGFFASTFLTGSAPHPPAARAAGATGSTGSRGFFSVASDQATTPERVFTGPSGEVLTVPGQVYTPSTVTETVTTTVTAPPPPPPPPPAPAAYVYAPLDGAIDTTTWRYESSAPQGGTPAGSFSWLTGGFKNGAIRYHTPAASTWTSTQSQLLSHFISNGSPLIHTAEGDTTWYRFEVRAGAGSFIPGEWDWLAEWHNNTSIVPGSVSSAWGLVSSGSISGPNPGTSPYLEFRASGGPNTAPVYTRYRMAPGSFTAGAWHDLIAEITWGPNATTGALSLWVDGQPFPGYTWPQHIPTLLYNSSSGQRDDPAFGIYEYHYAVTYPVDRDFDEVLIGSSAASVGFTP